MSNTGKKYTLPMKFKNDWINALKSGDFNQGFGMLSARIDSISSLNHNKKIEYCAIGLAMHVCSGIDNEILENMCTIEEIRDCYGSDWEDKYQWKLDIPWGHGLKSNCTKPFDDAVMELNDRVTSPPTFYEIAVWIDDNVDAI